MCRVSLAEVGVCEAVQRMKFFPCKVQGRNNNSPFLFSGIVELACPGLFQWRFCWQMLKKLLIHLDFFWRCC